MRFPFFLLLAICWVPACSQSAAPHYKVSDQDNEQMFVQVNSTFLLTGETLYFKIFCRLQKNNKPTMLSKIAYVELVDETGTPVFQAKIPLQEGSGHGDLFIPSTFPSGNYTLIAYTRWMKNFPMDSLSAYHITIVNPFRASVGVVKKTDGKTTPKDEAVSSQSDNVELKLSEKTLRTREKVSIALTGKDLTTVCISVRKREATFDDAGTMHPGSISPFSSRQELPSPTLTTTYSPEIRGHLVMGTLQPKGEVTARRNILASIPGSNFVFRAVATDQHGNFAMIVNDIPSSTILFQVLGDDIDNYTLEIEDPFLGDYSRFKREPLSIDASLQSVIDERSVFTQIENAFYETKRESLPPMASTSFYNDPDNVYRLDDFTRFPTMEDIFREYIPEVMVRRSKDLFSLHIVSPRSGYPYAREPLMLIDGVPMLSTNTLMAYDPLKVERIEVVRDKYVYGSLESDGIISLKTYKGVIEDLPSFNSHRENLVKINPGTVYSFPDYSADKLKLERVPDYRLQLYWNPNVSIAKDQGAVVEFYTSDVTGDFEIVVEGFSSDGKALSTRAGFSVLK